MKALSSFVIAMLLSAALASPANAKTLDIYFIDVEGGQSTLLVTPGGESLLIDTGFAGRDAKRILAAANDAGVKQIDYLLITHFHADHDGGAPELAQLLPIQTFIDHDTIADVEKSSAASMAAFNAYTAVRAKGKHINPKPGDRLPLKDVEAIVVSSATDTIRKSVTNGPAENPDCSKYQPAAADPGENPRSTGIVVAFGKFRFLDIGDLSGQPLRSLVCPGNLIGAVDAYLVAHHGGADSAQPATFAAFKPRVAIMNNGATKGGALVTYELLHDVKGLDDVWQLHRSDAAGKENFADSQVANLDDSTAHWIKLSANEDGSFKVMNARTGQAKSYRGR